MSSAQRDRGRNASEDEESPPPNSRLYPNLSSDLSEEIQHVIEKSLRQERSQVEKSQAEAINRLNNQQAYMQAEQHATNESLVQLKRMMENLLRANAMRSETEKMDAASETDQAGADPIETSSVNERRRTQQAQYQRDQVGEQTQLMNRKVYVTGADKVDGVYFARSKALSPAPWERDEDDMVSYFPGMVTGQEGQTTDRDIERDLKLLSKLKVVNDFKITGRDDVQIVDKLKNIQSQMMALQVSYSSWYKVMVNYLPSSMVADEWLLLLESTNYEPSWMNIVSFCLSDLNMTVYYGSKLERFYQLIPKPGMKVLSFLKEFQLAYQSVPGRLLPAESIRVRILGLLFPNFGFQIQNEMRSPSEDLNQLFKELNKQFSLNATFPLVDAELSSSNPDLLGTVEELKVMKAGGAGECFYCGIPGHVKANCLKFKRESGGSKVSSTMAAQGKSDFKGYGTKNGFSKSNRQGVKGFPPRGKVFTRRFYQLDDEVVELPSDNFEDDEDDELLVEPEEDMVQESFNTLSENMVETPFIAEETIQLSSQVNHIKIPSAIYNFELLKQSLGESLSTMSVQAMVDSGAEGIYITESLVKQLQIPIQERSYHIRVNGCWYCRVYD